MDFSFEPFHHARVLGGTLVIVADEMNDAVNIDVIASGGVTTVDDVRHLAELGVAGCIIGRALYEGTLSLPAALAAATSTTHHSPLTRSTNN